MTKSYRNIEIFKIPLLIVGLILAVSFCFNTVSAADSSHIYVSNAGNDNWNGQSFTHTSSITGPKKTIKNAISTVKSGGLINVASGTYNENNLVIDKSITIRGTGKDKTIVNGKKRGKIFIIKDIAKVTIENLMATNGKISGIGGAIENYGSLSLYNTALTNNGAKYGGAILNTGHLTVNGTNFVGNAASKFGGAIYNGHGTLHVYNTFCTFNHDDMGGAIFNYFGTTILKFDCFSHNLATSYGGAVYNSGTLTVYKTSFKSNTANINGGAILNNENSLLIANKNYFTGDSARFYGGAIYNLGSTTMTNNNFANNSGFEGASIFSSHLLNVYSCTFSNNKATSVGGGIDNYHGLSNLKNCSFISNISGRFGGAVYNDNQDSTNIKYTTLNIQNCIFTSNIAKSYGGAVHNCRGTLNVSYSKFIKNNAISNYGSALNNYYGNFVSRLNIFTSNGLRPVYTIGGSYKIINS